MTKLTYDVIAGYYHYWSDIYKTVEEFEEYFLMETRERIIDDLYYTKNDQTVILKPADHYPTLRKYEIYEAAYIKGNETFPPVYHGIAVARNFAQACHIRMCEKFLERSQLKNDVNEPEGKEGLIFEYNPEMLTFRGNKLCMSIECAKKIIERI